MIGISSGGGGVELRGRSNKSVGACGLSLYALFLWTDTRRGWWIVQRGEKQIQIKRDFYSPFLSEIIRRLLQAEGSQHGAERTGKEKRD